MQGWKTAGRIPATKQPAVLETAREAQLDVTAEDVIFPLRERVRAAGRGQAGGDHVDADTPQGQHASCGSGTNLSVDANQEFAAEVLGSDVAAAEGEGVSTLPGGPCA